MSKKGEKKKLPGKKSANKLEFGGCASYASKTNDAEMGEEDFFSKEDPQGMYTGKPVNPEDAPVQDADDL